MVLVLLLKLKKLKGQPGLLMQMQQFTVQIINYVDVPVLISMQTLCK